MHFLLPTLALLIHGCTPLEDGPLTATEAWEEVAAEDDPAADRPDTINCPTGSWIQEDLAGEPSVEIDTGLCNYLALGQPALTELEEGDTLHLRLWHLELYSDSASLAHAALYVADSLVWEEDIPIPSDAGMVRPEILVEEDTEAGAPVVFHLHNHGFNTWNLLTVEVVRD